MYTSYYTECFLQLGGLSFRLRCFAWRHTSFQRQLGSGVALLFRIKHADMVRGCFITATVALVFRAVDEEVAVQLPDMVFSQIDRIKVREDRFHHRGVPGNLLFVSRIKPLDLDVAEKRSHLFVGGLAAFDPRGRSDTLDRRHAAPVTWLTKASTTWDQTPRSSFRPLLTGDYLSVLMGYGSDG